MRSIFREPALPWLTTLLLAAAAEARAAEASDSKRRALEMERISLVKSLQAIAEAAEWSQRKLAKKLGIPPASWHKLANGRRPPLDWLPRLRQAAARLSA